MYKQSHKFQKTISKSYSNKAKTKHLRESGIGIQSVQQIPEIRRVIEVTDLDLSKLTVITLVIDQR